MLLYKEGTVDGKGLFVGIERDIGYKLLLESDSREESHEYLNLFITLYQLSATVVRIFSNKLTTKVRMNPTKDPGTNLKKEVDDAEDESG